MLSNGSWGPVISAGICIIHAINLPSGELLVWDRGVTILPDVFTTPSAKILNPFTHTSVPAPNMANNMFCGGHAQLSTGDILAAGGDIDPDLEWGTNLADIFTGAGWNDISAVMWHERWYPSLISLPNGWIIVMGGAKKKGVPEDDSAFVEEHEFYKPSTGTFVKLHSNANRNVNWYPFVFVLPKAITINGQYFRAGSLFFAGPYPISAVLDWYAPIPFWSVDFVDSQYNLHGTAVMYLPGKILKMCGILPGQNQVWHIDMTQNYAGIPSWSPRAPMQIGRKDANVVILADGTILVVGGKSNSDGSLVLIPELYNPATDTWTQLAPMTVPREYHSVALLLMDGTVFAGGGVPEESAAQKTYQIFTPPYLEGELMNQRPVIEQGAPNEIALGSVFELPYTSNHPIVKAALVRLGSVTHSFDMGQMYVPLDFVIDLNGNNLRVNAPPNANYAPPGNYMLFILNSVNGTQVPSVAKMVKVVPFP